MHKVTVTTLKIRGLHVNKNIQEGISTARKIKKKVITKRGEK